MDTPPNNRLEEIFADVSALPAADRAAWLDVACAEDPELRAEVEALLGSHDASGFMKSVPCRPKVDAELARLKPEEAGDYIGPYRLVEQLGEGGFGVVWKAQQERPVKRVVALKVIKIGMDTKDVMARFEQERQALAVMDHSNIAKVFDAGATKFGRPYFVMELVQGSRITDYCDKCGMGVRDRLELFIEVCRAVQHAHQKGIIHRDLKPSNILVTLQDGKPAPKVIDFGLAKAIERRLTDLTVYTELEQFIGTPLYMSPEQVQINRTNVDTRTDIYALGVLLYELLTGHTPFDRATLMETGFVEMCRIIREEEPPKPSTTLRTTAKANLGDVASHRRSEPAKLIHAISGDLDCIVMKTLAKDRARRYDTASELAADINRYLCHEPILARSPSRTYQFRRFVSRHKTGVAFAGGIAATLLTGVIVSFWQAAYFKAKFNDLRRLAPVLADEARQLVSANQYDQAILKLSDAIQIEPDTTEYLRERAALLRSQLRLAEAAEDYRRILARQPDDLEAHSNLVHCERLAALAARAISHESSPVTALLFDPLESQQEGVEQINVVKSGTKMERYHYDVSYRLKPGLPTVVDPGSYDIIVQTAGGGSFVLARGVVVKEGQRARINPNLLLGTLIIEPVTRKGFPAIRKLRVLLSGTTGFRLIFQQSNKAGVPLPILPGSYDIMIDTVEDDYMFTLLKNVEVKERQVAQIRTDQEVAGFIVRDPRIKGTRLESIHVVRAGGDKTVAQTNKFDRPIIVPADESYDVILVQDDKRINLKSGVSAKRGELIEIGSPAAP